VDKGLRNILWIILIIISAILLLGSWVFGSRIDDDIFSIKYIKESFDVFKLLMMFYFGAIFLIIILFYVLK